jgi:hypothetical protein
MQPKKILFVAYGAGHIAMVLPVIAELRERHTNIHIDLMALTTGGHVAKRQGFKTIGYSDFSHWYDGDKLKQFVHGGFVFTSRRSLPRSKSLC